VFERFSKAISNLNSKDSEEIDKKKL